MKKLKIFLFGAVASALFALCVPASAQSRGGSDSAGASFAEVTFRCTYWQRPKEKVPPLFVREGKNFSPIAFFEMGFQRSYAYQGELPIPVYRKATEAEAEQRKLAGMKKSEAEYVPYFTIDPQGMKDIGVLLLPGKMENKPANEMIVFNWSEKDFPFGSIRIMNLSKRRLMGQLTPRGAEKGERFQLNHKKYFTSKPIGDARKKMYELQLATVVNKKPLLVFSSSAPFFSDTRSMIFIIPAGKNPQQKDGVPEFDFKMLKDYKRPAAEADVPAARKNPNRRKPAPPPPGAK